MSLCDADSLTTAECVTGLRCATDLLCRSRADMQLTMWEQRQQLEEVEADVHESLLPLPVGLCGRLAMGIAGRNGSAPPIVLLQQPLPPLLAVVHMLGYSPEPAEQEEPVVMQLKDTLEEWLQGSLHYDADDADEAEAFYETCCTALWQCRAHLLRPWHEPFAVDCIVRLRALWAYARRRGGTHLLRRHLGGTPEQLPSDADADIDGRPVPRRQAKPQPEPPLPDACGAAHDWTSSRVMLPCGPLRRWLETCAKHLAFDEREADHSDDEEMDEARRSKVRECEAAVAEGPPQRLKWLWVERWQAEATLEMLRSAHAVGTCLVSKTGLGSLTRAGLDSLACCLGTFATVAWVFLSDTCFRRVRSLHPEVVVTAIVEAWMHGLEVAQEKVQQHQKRLAADPAHRASPDPAKQPEAAAGAELMSWLVATDDSGETTGPTLPPALQAAVLQELFDSAMCSLHNDTLFEACLRAEQEVLHSLVAGWQATMHKQRDRPGAQQAPGSDHDLAVAAHSLPGGNGAGGTAGPNSPLSPGELALASGCGFEWLGNRLHLWLVVLRHGLTAARAAPPEHPGLWGFKYGSRNWEGCPSYDSDAQVQLVRRAAYHQHLPCGLWVLMLGAETTATWLMRSLVVACETYGGRDWHAAFYPAALPMPDVMQEVAEPWEVGPGEPAAYEPLPGQMARVVLQILPPLVRTMSLPKGLHVDMADASSFATAYTRVLGNVLSGQMTVLRAFSGEGLATALLAVAKARMQLVAHQRRNCVVVPTLMGSAAKPDAWRSASALVAAGREGAKRLKQENREPHKDQGTNYYPSLDNEQLAEALGAQPRRCAACAPDGIGNGDGGAAGGGAKAGPYTRALCHDGGWVGVPLMLLVLPCSMDSHHDLLCSNL